MMQLKKDTIPASSLNVIVSRQKLAKTSCDDLSNIFNNS